MLDHSSEICTDVCRDVLSEVLQDLRPNGVSYGHCRFMRPWGVEIPADRAARLHVVVAGEWWLRPSGGEPVRLEAGDAALMPGGVAHALVELPASAFPKSDLAWAYIDVSKPRALSEEQSGEFSQTKPVTSADASTSVAGPDAAPTPKLMIGDLELQSTETVASQGKNEEAAKYYHVFENGACYEFALKVATSGVGDRPQQARGSRGSVRTAGENSGHGENQSSAGSDGNCTGGSSDEWSEPSTVIARAVLVARVRGQALPANSYHEDNCRTIAAMSFS